MLLAGFNKQRNELGGGASSVDSTEYMTLNEIQGCKRFGFLSFFEGPINGL